MHMKKGMIAFIGLLVINACNNSEPAKEEAKVETNSLEGTWKLVSATTIKKTDTTVTDFAAGQEMIKVINKSHFAFLRHDTNQGKDTAIFSAGGGTYTLAGDKYTELLQYCNDRGWEGHSFSFTVSVKEDTLLQTGVEKLEKENVDQFIIEKYLRVK
jgi:hypothetical protein